MESKLRIENLKGQTSVCSWPDNSTFFAHIFESIFLSFTLPASTKTFDQWLACAAGARREREQDACEREDTHEKERLLQRPTLKIVSRVTDFARARLSESLKSSLIECLLRRLISDVSFSTINRLVLCHCIDRAASNKMFCYKRDSTFHISQLTECRAKRSPK